MADMTESLGIDTTEFVSSIEKAAVAAEQAGTRTITIIHQQETSWIQFAAVAIPAAIQMTAATMQLAAATVQVGSAFAGFVSENAATFGRMGAAAVAAGLTMTGSWQSAGATLLRFGGIANSLARTFIPQWRIAGLVVTGSLLAYKAATSEMGQSAASAVAANATVSASFTKLKASVSGLGKLEIFGGGSEVGTLAAGNAISWVVQNLTPLPAIAKFGADTLASGMSAAADAITATGNAAQSLSDNATGLALAFADGDWIGATAGKFSAEAAALRELATETARVMALQESHKAGYKALGDMQKDASEAAARAEELAAVGNLKTTGQIEEKWRAVQKLNIELERTGEKTAGSVTHARNLFNALAAQRAGVESGRITEETVTPKEEKAAAVSPVTQAMEAAQAQLDKLTMGEEAYAAASLRSKQATVEEQIAFAAIQSEIAAVTAAKKAEKEATDAAAKAAKDAADAEKRAAEENAKLQEGAVANLRKLQDEIDIKTGAATKGEVALRNMLAQGVDQETALATVTAQDELDKLAEADKGKSDKSGPTSAKASFAGSSDVASIFLRGVGSGGDKDSTAKKIDKSNDYLKIIADHASKSSQLMAGGSELQLANFGRA